MSENILYILLELPTLWIQFFNHFIRNTYLIATFENSSCCIFGAVQPAGPAWNAQSGVFFSRVAATFGGHLIRNNYTVPTFVIQFHHFSLYCCDICKEGVALWYGWSVIMSGNCGSISLILLANQDIDQALEAA